MTFSGADHRPGQVAFRNSRRQTPSGSNPGIHGILEKLPKVLKPSQLMSQVDRSSAAERSLSYHCVHSPLLIGCIPERLSHSHADSRHATHSKMPPAPPQCGWKKEGKMDPPWHYGLLLCLQSISVLMHTPAPTDTSRILSGAAFKHTQMNVWYVVYTMCILHD